MKKTVRVKNRRFNSVEDEEKILKRFSSFRLHMCVGWWHSSKKKNEKGDDFMQSARTENLWRFSWDDRTLAATVFLSDTHRIYFWMMKGLLGMENETNISRDREARREGGSVGVEISAT